MVDSITNSMNRIDIQRARVNESDAKQGAKGSAIGKDLSLDKSELEVSDKVANLAKKPPIDSEAVLRIKNAIADGKYPIDIDAVSDALMDAYRDMKS
ncbi:flagellar biosynthesis anti-sigma factor FlgM [Alphaproteobacteria bacterium]|nr:flagellar biosynthesis anti-sigma factor FlgM [Alphaproteobacteria bacterium]